MRYFLGIDLSEEIRHELVGIQQKLKKLNLFSGSYVPPDNLHVTLMFFGSLNQESLDHITTTLTQLAHKPFTLQLGKLEMPNPKLIWVTLPSRELANLYTTLAMLFPQYEEKRSYSGHITLARTKLIPTTDKLSLALQDLQIGSFSWIVDHITLFQSDTLPTGPVYTNIKRVELNKMGKKKVR